MNSGKQIYPKDSERIMYFGDPAVNTIPENRRKSIHKVTIYTQPDQSDIYIPLIERFIELEQVYDFCLKIRKHPRDFSDLSKLPVKYDTSKDILSSLSQTDLAVSHFSTCLSYALAKGIPYISYCLDYGKYSNLSFMSVDVCRVFSCLDKINTIFEEKNVFLDNYYSKRSSYISNNQLQFNSKAYNLFLEGNS